MNKPNKCKNCQWYGKPYWSIINPCDNCSNENEYKTIITIDGEPIFNKTLTEEEIKKSMTEKNEIKEILDKLQKVANRETASRNALMEMKDKDYQLLLDYINNLKERNEKATNKIQYIIDYGFDYDGFNTVESLKGLIDMLVDYARQSKDILKGSDKE